MRLSQQQSSSQSQSSSKLNGQQGQEKGIDTKDINANGTLKEIKAESKVEVEVEVKEVELDLGYLLVAFFHHFGNPNNLNSDTIVKLRIKSYTPKNQAKNSLNNESNDNVNNQVNSQVKSEGKNDVKNGEKNGVIYQSQQEEQQEEILEAEADFTRSMQVTACQKVFQTAHSILLGDLKSCEPIKGKGTGTGAVSGNGGGSGSGSGGGSGRYVRTLRWLQPQFDSTTSG